MTDRPDDSEVSLPEDLTASMRDIWRRERGDLPEDVAAGHQPEPDVEDEVEPVDDADVAVLERISPRPRIEHYYRWAMGLRDENCPRTVKRFLRRDEVRYGDDQDPADYLQGERWVSLVDEFSELVEELLEERIHTPELAVGEAFESMVKQKCEESLSMYELRCQLQALCTLSEAYRKDLT